MKALLVIFVFFAWERPGWADDLSDARARALEAFVRSASSPDHATGIPDVPDVGALSDPSTQRAYQDALRAYYEYRGEVLRHRVDVFDWQLASSRIIFGVVLLIVGVGLLFSWQQFHGSRSVLRRGRMKAVEVEDTQEAPVSPVSPVSPSGPPTTIKASLGGIEVSSPVLGVVILALSLAFFYLYLVYVYPIHETF